jgi:dethiobiotin synthetase
MPPERLEKPLAPHITALLENVERMAARRFFETTTPRQSLG